MSNVPFPTPTNYLVKENEGTIVYQKSVSGIFYFAVEAVEDCPYSVSVSEEEVRLTKIDHDQLYDIKLEKGEMKWFYHRHGGASPIKVLSILKHG
jgi:hypothetical protein